VADSNVDATLMRAPPSGQDAAMQTILTPDAPAPAGHYSQAVVHGDVIYVAGQLPIDPQRPGFVQPTIEEQTERALRNVEAILKAGGSSLHRLLQVTIYISDMSLWGRVNAVYEKALGAHRPARAVVPTLPLHFGYLIEIQAIAAIN
jgi:2-iminobutanoate/2-iminopropanoate deaminase